MIRTTINVTLEVYQRILEAAEERGIDVETLIVAMMQYFSKKYRKDIIIGNAVHYQERMPDENYVRVHVNWFEHEYEFLLDLRKVHKKSVSRLIAEAVLTYLNNFSVNIDDILDNYKDQPYAFSKFAVQDVIGCIFLWGYPIKTITN